MKRCKLFSFWSKGWKQGWSWFRWLLQIESEWCGSDLETPESYSLHKITSGSEFKGSRFSCILDWLTLCVGPVFVCPLWLRRRQDTLSFTENMPTEPLTVKIGNVEYKTTRRLDRYDILAQNAVCKSIQANEKAFQKLRQTMVPFSFKNLVDFFWENRPLIFSVSAAMLPPVRQAAWEDPKRKILIVWSKLQGLGAHMHMLKMALSHNSKESF